MSHFVEFINVSKHYHMGEVTITAANKLNLSVDKGELVVIVGPSGAGKTTVLNMLGGMDSVDEGQLLIDGKDIARCSRKQLTEYRRTDVGFVFQFYNLVPNLTALENVELATQICKNSLNAKETLVQVGLADRINNFPSQLSGGEQQRVAIARALAKNPKLLLCDEPTGALDYVTGKQVLQLLRDMCRQLNMTVIIVTHNLAITPMADRVIKIKNAQIESVTVNDHPMDIERIEW
ncbi:MAG: ABC transporter ATP-binding protein [Erysipelotrichaceae bacterium]|nr:ABC transporter ATP-binding protein [Erysipelotrichaceae bacterium]